MSRTKGAKTRKANPGNTNRRFSLTQREGIKREAVRLDLQGHGPTAIAELLDVSPATACNLLKEIRQDYHDAYVDDRKMWAMRELGVLMDVRQRAYAQIALLQQRGKRKTVTKTGGGGDDAGGVETTDTVEDAELLGWHNLVKETVRDAIDLLGLRELPKQVFNVQVNNNTVNVFDQLYEALFPKPALADGAPGPVVDATPQGGE